MKLNELVKEYTDYLYSLGHRERGVKSYEYNITRFIEWLGDDNELSALTLRNIRKYQIDMGRRRLDPGTINNNLGTIKSFCIYLVSVELLQNDPTIGIKRPKEPDDAPRALTAEQLVRVWGIIKSKSVGNSRQTYYQDRDKRAMALMLLAGLRIAECAALTWKDVDIDNREIFVRSGKGGRDRKIPMNEELYAILSKVPSDKRKQQYALTGKFNGTPVTSKSLAHLFERGLVKHGLTISAHQLRHSFATELFRSGVHIRTIQYLLGHHQLETTMRYLSVDDDQKRDAVSKLIGWYSLAA